MNFRTKAVTVALAAALSALPAISAPGRRSHFASQERMGAGMLQHFGAALNLTEEQKQFARQLMKDTRAQSQPLADQLRANRDELAAAVKANNTGAISQIAERQGALTGQVAALHAKSMATFYAQLTPEQKAKAEELQANRKERLQNWRERQGRRDSQKQAQ